MLKVRWMQQKVATLLWVASEKSWREVQFEKFTNILSIALGKHVRIISLWDCIFWSYGTRHPALHSIFSLVIYFSKQLPGRVGLCWRKNCCRCILCQMCTKIWKHGGRVRRKWPPCWRKSTRRPPADGNFFLSWLKKLNMSPKNILQEL